MRSGRVAIKRIQLPIGGGQEVPILLQSSRANVHVAIQYFRGTEAQLMRQISIHANTMTLIGSFTILHRSIVCAKCEPLWGMAWKWPCLAALPVPGPATGQLSIVHSDVKVCQLIKMRSQLSPVNPGLDQSETWVRANLGFVWFTRCGNSFFRTDARYTGMAAVQRIDFQLYRAP